MKFEHGQLYNCESTSGAETWVFESSTEYSSGLADTLIGTLDKLGDRGWELAGITSHSNSAFYSGFQYVYVFKRPKI
ncbi:MAG: hypothetical protein FWB91_12435 [Defluviitaleaceae bacterium]|nr:hypothetical protein [Defluviitaleaceae bacterium]